MKASKILVLLMVITSAGCGGDAMTTADASSKPAPAPAPLPAPAPAAKADAAATQPTRVVGIPQGWEIAPRAKCTARQSGGVVTITARGENPTGGYEARLFESPLRIWPPQFILARKKPDGPATQAITPFEVTASFKADRRVATVVVNDATGRNLVNVAQD